nr:MAG TPA: hypothetical protein [Caudoviricetes sp.]
MVQRVLTHPLHEPAKQRGWTRQRTIPMIGATCSSSAVPTEQMRRNFAASNT